MGIEAVDVRIKQINLPTEVSEAIYNRMRAEREAVARRHRSQGQEEGKTACGRFFDYEVTKTLAKPSVRGVSCVVKVMPEAAKPFADAARQTLISTRVHCSLRAYEKSSKVIRT